MQHTLQSTIIKPTDDIELRFQKIIKYNKFGCNAIFYECYSKVKYQVVILSKALLHLNKYKEQLDANVKKYRNMKCKTINRIYSYTDDGNAIYIVSQLEKYRLSQLLQRRQSLTQFQALYFLLSLMDPVNYLKCRNCFYQIFQLDDIYLSKQMRLSLPFSLCMTHFDDGRFAPIRHEDKNRSICPEILQNQKITVSIDEINSWNIGIFLYQLLQGKKPFKNEKDLNFSQKISKQMRHLISKLLQPKVKNRLKYQLILVHDLFKKYRNLPHILPETIFSCPPSSQYIQDYDKQLLSTQEYTSRNKDDVIKTTIQVHNFQEEEQGLVKNFKTENYIKPIETTLTDYQAYIYEYSDISHSLGYGYQMNTGIICFVYNDRTSMYFQDQSKKTVFYISQSKQVKPYNYEKFPEEGQLKKKLLILEAYNKSIKKFKQKPHHLEKVILINEYIKTDHAAVFQLSNMSIQIYFNDKISFLITKNSIYIQNKNSDRFQPYENITEATEIQVRKRYSLTAASKFFHWDVTYLEKMKGKQVHHKNLCSKEEISAKSISQKNLS